jgi:hypothetical protein
MKHLLRVVAGIAGLAASMSLSGCMSSPTYGTDKTAAEHLLDDVSNIASVTPDNRNDQVAYNPHPKLVVPGDKTDLSAPQPSVADRKNNPNWVESPEETRQRLRDEADAGGNSYHSPLLKQNQVNQQLSTAQQREAYREARKIQQGLYSDKRRFLSDPPLDYRKIDTAEMNDLGEPERKKEAERKKQAAAAKQSSGKWWDIFD